MTERAGTKKSGVGEETLAFNRVKKPIASGQQSTLEGTLLKGGPRDDLVERVMDSLKLLSRREDESKKGA